MKLRLVIWFVVLVSFSISVQAQKKIVVIGSSTAAGVGASDRENLGWVGLLKTYYKAHPVGGDSVVTINLAIGGTTTKDGLPGTPHGITAALNLAPDVVLVNYPSNDIVAGISKEQTVANLQIIFNAAQSQHVKCFISTSQPRNFSEANLRQSQYDLKNLILERFDSSALNFWDGITTTDGGYRILPQYMGNPEGDSAYPPDGIHLNDAGHKVLFNVVLHKDIFGNNLPQTIGEIYPTPATNKINFTIQSEESYKLSLLVYDATGRLFKRMDLVVQQGRNTFSIDISNLAAGVWILKFQTPGKIITRRFIKN